MEDENQLENTEQPEISEDENTSMEMETPKNPLYAIGSKKLIELLLKKKMIVVGIVVMAVVLLFIFVIAIFSEGTDLDKFRYKENATCDSVSVTYEPFDGNNTKMSMELEEYVESAILSYTANLKDIPKDLFNYYFALAVAVRTEAISSGCKVTTHDKISKQSTSNQSLKKAMDLSKGIVLTDSDDNLIDVKVSNFCWREQNDEFDYVLYQGSNLLVPYSTVNQYLDNEVYEICSCNNSENTVKPSSNSYNNTYDVCWAPIYEEEDIDEDGLDIIDYEWTHQESEEGYSVLGSLYVYLETGKDYFNLLQYFFGDISLMTTLREEPEEDIIANSSTNCSVFSLFHTTLSRSTFISDVQNYNSSISDWKVFQENAGLIYDIAKKNNINPEIIVTRAFVEGFSPGGNSHNYFGITCYNGQPEKCSRYNTFEEGIEGFIRVISKYASFEKLTQSYAYLGDYWYNPGSDGEGGCAYASSISTGNDPYVQDACSEARRGHCSVRGDQSMCLPTREEDKAAYGIFQNRRMISSREAIFHLSQDSCTNQTLNYGNCVLFNQADPRWGSNALGHSKVDTLASAGCAVTSVSIALTCTGQITDEDFSPAVLNEQLKAIPHGFDDSLIYWDNSVLTSYVPNFVSHGSEEIKYTDSMTLKIEKLKNALGDRKIPIVHLSRGHYVVLVSVNDVEQTISVLDPSGGKENTIDINQVDGVRYYTY